MARSLPRALLLLAGAASAAAACAGPSAADPEPVEPVERERGGDPEAAPPAIGAPEVLGYSRAQRPLLAETLGSGAPRVYLIASIHGNEREGLPAVAALRRVLERGALPGTWRILEDLNPDGSARNRRGNAAGVDLNRNWPARNFEAARDHGPKPLSEPESAALHDDLLAFAPERVIVLHSTADGPFVNYDGPAESLARAFAAAAGWRVRADMGYPTPGSLGSWLGVDQALPVLTIEFRRGVQSPAAVQHALAGLAAAGSFSSPSRSLPP